MKKLSIFLAFVMLIISFSLVGCGKKNNELVVNEVARSIFYAPMYVAITNGYFEDEDISISLVTGNGADQSMTALLSGNADIGLMGPEAAIYVKSGGAQNSPVVFGQLTKRDGSFLIARTAMPNFQWSDLQGKEVIAGRRGGVPAMTLQYTIEEINSLTIGTGATEVKFNLDVSFPLMAPTFDSGVGDYVTLFEPTASEFVAAGKGHIVASVGQASGPVPYTAFMAKQNWLTSNEDKAVGFLRAIIKGYRFLLTATNDQIATALSPFFTSISSASIYASIQSYVSIDAWANTPVMAEAQFNKLQDIMENANELDDGRVSYWDVVNNSFAYSAIASLA
ncbi:MAG: ABC transporter substrate-binding protein [Clostridia bacterium]